MKFSSGSSPRLTDRFLGLIENIPYSDRLLVRLAFFVVIATGIWLFFSINQYYSEDTPVRGGSITEGIVGTPRFVNPALAQTRADQDVTALIFSGLMKITPEGVLENDIAENISLSEDGLTYTVTIRKDVSFHDGTPLTARDVAYTLLLIQNPDLKSPLRGNWTDVSIEEINEYELKITLEEPYTPFIENFTTGIMPAHIWSTLPIEQIPFSQLNTEPIGSGPFSVVAAKRDPSGIVNHYTLAAFRKNNADPKIDTIELAFFQNEDSLVTALMEDKLNATAYVSPERLSAVEESFRLVEAPLPRTFGIFFNQNRSTTLRDAAAREALTVAIDRGELIDKTLYGHGVPMSAPIPTATPALESSSSSDTQPTNTEQAIAILKTGGWTQNNLGLWEKQINKETVVLSITLKTSNTPLFAALVDSIAAQWRAIGVEVSTEQFEQTGLIQSVIRPRDFETLLFGLDMSRSYDLYPFWHSSQQDDPGLNIAQYANVEVDKLLEKARVEQNEQTRQELLQSASALITKEKPAIFLFQPTFTYVIDDTMTVTEMKKLGRPADRFTTITQWHTENDSLWKIFHDDVQ
jgi:peptide/nickel transport system substrate-binding protein